MLNANAKRKNVTMATKIKTWAKLGITCLLVGGSITACTPKKADTNVDRVDTTEVMTEDHTTSSHNTMDTLPVEHRLAFMSGHVQAGLALYRAGKPEMGAPHLLHPVSETHQAERAGLDALGFTPEAFETVSKALEEGRPASEIQPQLLAAEANLRTMANQAGGDRSGIIRFLMDTIVEEYTIAITGGAVSDPGEYQDAYGFAIVAREHAVKLGNASLVAEIDRLISYFPKGAPIPPDAPASVAEVSAQTSKVLLALPG